MSRAIVLRPDAEAELEDGQDYLEQFRPGSGAALEAAVEAAFARIVANPRLGTEVQPGVRRLMVSGTKYCVIYLFDDDAVDVVSVFHTSRDPADWQRRV